MVRSEHVDPRAGRVTFKTYAEDWRKSQVHRPTSALTIESTLRKHAYPTLGDRPLSTIEPSTIHAWVKEARLGHAKRSRRSTHIPTCGPTRRSHAYCGRLGAFLRT